MLGVGAGQPGPGSDQIIKSWPEKKFPSNELESAYHGHSGSGNTNMQSTYFWSFLDLR